MHYLKYSHNPFCMDFNLGHRGGTNEEVLYLKLPSPFYCYHFWSTSLCIVVKISIWSRHPYRPENSNTE